jgi:regulator of RNase E activity RraA
MTLPAVFETVSSSVVSDALDRLGIAGQCDGLFPIAPNMRVAGRAYTVKLAPHNAYAGQHDEYMDELGAGQVCVMDAREIRRGAVWGDLRSIVAQKNGAAGCVIDGALRDTAACLEIGFPIFTRWQTMLTGGRRVWIEAKAVPVSIGGVYVKPGDIVFGDTDGVAVIPEAREEEVIDLIAKLEEADRKIVDAIHSGMTLKAARAEFGVKKP